MRFGIGNGSDMIQRSLKNRYSILFLPERSRPAPNAAQRQRPIVNHPGLAGDSLFLENGQSAGSSTRTEVVGHLFESRARLLARLEHPPQRPGAGCPGAGPARSSRSRPHKSSKRTLASDLRWQCGEKKGSLLKSLPPDPSTYTTGRLDLLIKAGALIAAEIDRRTHIRA